jgi:DNA-binding GntR family transcriptional regulator
MKVNYQTVEELVTQRLRQAIVMGKFQAGQHLQQDELAEQLGVSRIPIRAALRVLEAEGLVEFKPHRGVMLTRLTRADLSDIFDARILLEVRATELAVPHLSGAQLEKMRTLLEELARCETAEQRANLNLLFHHTLYEAAQRPHLLNLIYTLRNRVGPYLQTYLLAEQGSQVFREAQVEHERLVQACESQEVEAAMHITREHLSNVLARLLERVPDEE